MNKSYSKIRHIQESNRRLEETLLNEQNANLAGLKARVGASLGNVFTGADKDRSPAIEAAFARIKAKSDQLYYSLTDYSTDLQKTFTDREREMYNSIQKTSGNAEQQKIMVDALQKQVDSEPDENKKVKLQEKLAKETEKLNRLNTKTQNYQGRNEQLRNGLGVLKTKIDELQKTILDFNPKFMNM
jgi:chromosome segregation ATPase